jgi:hypothetical protein
MTTPAHADAPVPQLMLGAHLCAEDGACLMEAVSVCAGDPWSDHPQCTHPLLAHVARLVNDVSSPQGRELLTMFVSRLAAAVSRHPAAYPRVALACLEMAARHRPSLLVAHLRLVSSAQLARDTAATSAPWDTTRAAMTRSLIRLRQRLYQRGPAIRAVEASVASVCRLPQPQRDRALIRLLSHAVAAVKVGDTAAPTLSSHDARLERPLRRLPTPRPRREVPDQLRATLRPEGSAVVQRRDRPRRCRRRAR